MLVSVLISCYRRRAFLPSAVESALAQNAPGSGYEVVVVKDFSDPAVDADWRSRGVRIVNGDLPVVGQMMLAGLRECRGEVVCFLDDDDAFHPSKLAQAQDAFEHDPELSLLRNGFEPVDRAGRPVPELRRVLPQPRTPFAFEPNHATGRDLSRVIRTRAYGNLSTFSVRRKPLLARAEDLGHVEACTDGSVATLMLDAGGRHRFVPERWTRRRVGTSFRSLGKGAEARRAVRTFEHLRVAARTAPARRYADVLLSWAKVDAFLNSEDGRLSLAEWLAFARNHLPRLDADTWETEAWSLGKWVAPGMVIGAYRRRREGLATLPPPDVGAEEPAPVLKH